MKIRAMDSEDKALRRSALLDAAQHLFLQDGHSLPSVARIAAEAGLAKGTVYLYFNTKEEIFAALLEQEFTVLLNRIGEVFQQGHADMASLLPAFLQAYEACLSEQPAFLRLAGMSHSVLEQNLPLEQGRAFNLRLMQGLDLAGKRLEACLPQLAVGQGAALLLRTHALTLGLWQMLDYPASMAPAPADSLFALVRPAFASELAIALAQLWRGALAE